MIHLRNCFNICIKVYRQPTIHNAIKHLTFRHTSATAVSKSLVGYENKFAHNVLETNPKCRVLRGEQNGTNGIESAEFDFEQNWEDLTTGGIVEYLKTVGNYCKENRTTVSDERFDKFVDVCTERCFDFTDDQLIQSLQILTSYPPTESLKSRNFAELWNALDDACVKRIDTWEFDKILYVCDHWYMLQLGRINKFNLQGSLKIGKKLRKLPTHQLVQLMFYLNVIRVHIPHMIEIEINLVNSMGDLSLNEIAVVCMGFFKTQTTIKTPKLVKKICTRLLSEIDTVEGIALSCILKALRISCSIYQIALVRELLDALNGQLCRLSTLTCLHVALLGTNLHICHQSCIEQILHRFSDEVKSIRMKDFERISFVMGFFDFESESQIENRLCQQFLDELKSRTDDIVQHPKCFVLCLHYLTMKGYYDEELISVALSAQFLNSAYGSQVNYSKEVFNLDSYVKINLKGTYTGNELTERIRRYLGKEMTDCIPDLTKERSATDKILMELKETSDELCTHSYLAHALPHFSRPDILIAYDEHANIGIDISHQLPPNYTGQIIDRSMLVGGITTDTTNVEIVNIIVGGANNYVRDTQKLTGYTRQKIQQSRMLGLRPVLIPGIEWTRLQKGDRNHYVKYKMKMELREK